MDSTDHRPCETSSCSASTQPPSTMEPHTDPPAPVLGHVCPLQTLPYRLFMIHFNIIYKCYAYVSREVSFLQVSQTNSASISCMPATCHTQLNFLGFILQIIFNKGYIINYLITDWRGPANSLFKNSRVIKRYTEPKLQFF